VKSGKHGGRPNLNSSGRFLFVRQVDSGFFEHGGWISKRFVDRQMQCILGSYSLAVNHV